MTNILAILGTPRKKNTYQIINRIEENIKELDGETNFEYLFLHEYKMDFCKGCFSCILNGEDTCESYDITRQIKEKIEAADGVIFASPVYVKQVSALMKNFLDHFSYLVHRPDNFDKAALAISTTNGSGLKNTLDYLEETVKTFGFNFVDKFGIMKYVYEKGGKETKKANEKIKNISRDFLNRIESKKHNSPNLNELLHFKITRLVIEFVRDLSPVDYDFWVKNGWYEKDYFVDVRIKPFTKLMGNMIFSSIEKQFRKEE
ncbi:MAG: flavodoxin family protein [Candidatus Heimdallarchaeota archaeon]